MSFTISSNNEWICYYWSCKFCHYNFKPRVGFNFSNIGDGRGIMEDSMMIAHSSGLVEWNPAMILNAWCDVEDLGVWPRDKHKCILILGIKDDFNYIHMEFVKNESSLVGYILFNYYQKIVDKTFPVNGNKMQL